MMGLFSMYTGLLYNDIFSRGLHFWSSAWSFSEANGTSTAILNEDYRYPFGLDPSWHGARNALVFTNSYKMKTSIILGVTHVSYKRRHLNQRRRLNLKLIDDTCIVSTSAQSLEVQAIFGYLYQLHATNDLSAVDFRLPCLVYPV